MANFGPMRLLSCSISMTWQPWQSMGLPVSAGLKSKLSGFVVKRLTSANIRRGWTDEPARKSTIFRIQPHFCFWLSSFWSCKQAAESSIVATLQNLQTELITFIEIHSPNFAPPSLGSEVVRLARMGLQTLAGASEASGTRFCGPQKVWLRKGLLQTTRWLYRLHDTPSVELTKRPYFASNLKRPLPWNCLACVQKEYSLPPVDGKRRERQVFKTYRIPFHVFPTQSLQLQRFISFQVSAAAVFSQFDMSTVCLLSKAFGHPAKGKAAIKKVEDVPPSSAASSLVRC